MEMHVPARRRAGLIAAALVLGGLAACAPVDRSHGHLWRGYQPSDITVGQDTRDTVRSKAGSPSMISLREQETWIYVSRETSEHSPRLPEVTGQRIVIIAFDEDGNVASVDERGLEQGQEIEFSDEKTPNASRPLNIFRQLLGNIGRFEG